MEATGLGAFEEGSIALGRHQRGVVAISHPTLVAFNLRYLPKTVVYINMGAVKEISESA